jgi:V/A-type H+-transporting ATPase subunit D
MAKIKYTKNELKRQRDGLSRYRRYLPTLLLKKQQLQMELRKLEREIVVRTQDETALRDQTSDWIALFAEPQDLEAYLSVKSLETETANVAGVPLTLLKEIYFEKNIPNLFDTPPWIDDALQVLEKLARLRLEILFLSRRQKCIAEELRTTSQRVNLFEKLKIPEALEAIRGIRIYLGDQQTAAVGRSKIAKQKAMRFARLHENGV